MFKQDFFFIEEINLESNLTSELIKFSQTMPSLLDALSSFLFSKQDGFKDVV